MFFDLKFYIQVSSRSGHGIYYNLWDKGCKLVDGPFLFANLENDFGLTKLIITKE